MKTLLNIPHRTQLGNKQRNDCGAAVVSMLTNASVDAVLQQVLTAEEMNRHKSLDFFDIYKGLRHYGISFEYRRGITPTQIRQAITNGNPVIGLINYGRLPFHLKNSNFIYDHFVLIYGFDDDHLYWHDPLSFADKENKIPDAVYQSVVRTMAWRNQPRQSILITTPFSKSTDSAETIDAIDAISDMLGIDREMLVDAVRAIVDAYK